MVITVLLCKIGMKYEYACRAVYVYAHVIRTRVCAYRIFELIRSNMVNENMLPMFQENPNIFCSYQHSEIRNLCQKTLKQNVKCVAISKTAFTEKCSGDVYTQN